ncbi:hypothetical protein TUM16657_14860 [Enterobacter cloacae]|nr:hypothetical protein TUM16654_34100 [Enterobacter cloacae]GJK08892.1 hypothetical protein TUM16657_14860 [Enterobacter cloacae]
MLVQFQTVPLNGRVGQRKSPFDSDADSALNVVVNAQADAQWDVADSQGWLKRISKLDAAE